MVDGKMAFGRFCLSFGRRELLKNGVAVPLGSRAFERLAALVRRSGNIDSKEERRPLGRNMIGIGTVLPNRADAIPYVQDCRMKQVTSPRGYPARGKL